MALKSGQVNTHGGKPLYWYEEKGKRVYTRDVRVLDPNFEHLFGDREWVEEARKLGEIKTCPHAPPLVHQFEQISKSK